MAQRLSAAVEKATERPWYAHAWRFAAFAALAAAAITLGLVALSARHVSATVGTPAGPRHVSVTAAPKPATDVLALASVLVGGVSAVASVGSVVVAVVALRKPAP